MGLVKEIWLKTLFMLFLEKPTFLDLAMDLTPYLEEGGMVINLAHAGADPAVFVNNAVWPLSIQQLTEVASALPLDTMITAPTVVREVDKKQYAYDKQQGDVMRHVSALVNVMHLRGAYNIGPSTHNVLRPVLETTGAVKTDGSRAMQFKDIITLGKAFNKAGIPQEDRVLVLTPEHEGDLMEENLQLLNSLVSGERPNKAFTFKIEQSNMTPVYNSNTGAKGALGAVENPAGQIWSGSVAFHKACFGSVRGAAKFFSRIDDPEHAGSIINYQQYFLALPIRNYGLGAIINGL